MATKLEDLVQRFGELASLRSSVTIRIQEAHGPDGTQFDLSASVPGLEISISQIDVRVAAICEMSNSLTAEDNALLIPQNYIDNLAKPLARIIDNYKAVADAFNGIDSNGGIGGLEPTSFSVRSKNAQVTLDLGSQLQTIWSHSAQVLSGLYPLINVIAGKGYTDFSAALESMARVVAEFQHGKVKFFEELSNDRVQLSKLIDAANREHAAVLDLHKRSSPLRDEIERLKGEAEIDRKSLGEYASQGTQSISAVRAVSEQAEQLRVQVENYRATFDGFQKQLEQREQSIKQGSATQEDLVTGLREIEQKITLLNEQAEGMLTGATVAGLAGSFGELREKLSEELRGARRIFYFSIFVLFVSVLPLAAYVIPSLGDFLSLSTASDAARIASIPELVGHIVARALLLLPAAWFAKFAAGRHAVLFRLKEHYAYKYSVAASVEGFKKQAEPFKDAIAATSFFELTFNPADRMEIKSREERHPNPAMEWLMRKLGATYDGSIG